jgi:polar amino acid transport system substrate-binding protein
VNPGTVVAIAVLLATGLIGGCASSSDDAMRSAVRAVHPPPTTSTPTTTTQPAPPCQIGSLRPDPQLPAPGAMPAGSSMAAILQRGYLRVGVDENTLGFAWRNESGRLEGLEIELVREIARAIFGDPDRVRYISVVTDNKVDVVAHGDVDLTASVVSITCSRLRQVAFSSEYYTTVQRALVNANSPFEHLADLDRRKVCVTRGSTTIAEIHKTVPGAIPYPVAARTDCLVALQEGRADAIATHESILRGLAYQDPKTTRFLPESFGDQHYGIAIGKDHADLVRFVNGVLERMRADGSLRTLYGMQLERWGIKPPPVPAANYRSEES